MRVFRWTAALALFFLVLTEHRSWEAVIVAAVAGAAVAVLSARGTRAPQRDILARTRSLALLPWLVLGATWLVIRGSVTLLGALASRGRALSTRRIEVPFGDRTDEGVAVSGLILTAAPGSALAEVDEDRRVMIVYEAEPDDAAIEAHQRFYRRFQRPVRP